MIHVRQKHKHCFVACCASVLGQSSIADQEAIVSRFPTELQKGTANEGVPNTSKEVFAVIVGLGISLNPSLLVSTGSSYSGIADFLRANRQHAERMMIFTKHPTNHCLRIREIRDDGLTIMNPELHDFSPMSWQEFEATLPAILLL